jgi:hypothetical protein
MKRFTKLNKEYKDLEEIVESYFEYKKITEGIAEARDILKNEKDKETRENLLHAGFVIFVSWLSVGIFVGFVCLIFLAYMLYYMKEPLRNTIVASLPGLPGIPVNRPVGQPVVPVVPVEIQLPRQVL